MRYPINLSLLMSFSLKPNRRSLIALSLLCILVQSLLSLLSAAEHPRLLFSESDIPELREKIRKEPWKSMYARLLADAEKDVMPFKPYNDAWRASSCGFLYILTGDESWAEKARDYTQAVLDNPDRWGHRLTFGLRMYTWNRHVAQAYDFCYASDAWDASFNATVSAALKQQSDVIHLEGGTRQNTNASSNWQGLRGASAVLGYLATDDPYDAEYLTASIDRMRDYLDANLGTHPSPGWNYEGLGYMTFPMAAVGPAALAYERLVEGGDRFMGNAAMANTWWTATGHTALYRSIAIETAPDGIIGSHFDFTDDNNHSAGEGTYGLGFAFLPEALIPGQVWMYDRMRGMNGDQTWDNERAGVIYSILYHPGNEDLANPMTIPQWKALFQDHRGNGWNIFRNRYQDENDVILGINLRRRTPGGHDGPDGLSFRINGMGGPLAIGGGRYSKGNPYYRLQNTLYVENPGNTSPSEVDNRLQGEIVSTADTPLLNKNGSGALVGHMETTNLNVKNHTRRLLTDFSAASGAEAVFVVADTSENGHFWQYVAVNGLNDISTSGNTFTVTAPNGSLRATVIYPRDFRFDEGDLDRGSDFFFNGERYRNAKWINSFSEDGDHLVVMTVVPEGAPHPEIISLRGSGVTDRTLRVGQLGVIVNGEDIRVSRSDF
ncbi:MAG: hypothetical protein ACLFU4_05360 [Opitutales bacterium]